MNKTVKKTVKSTKKIANKLSTVSTKVRPLNKKNAVKFGNSLFSIKNGVIQCLVMCDGTLQDGKVGGRTTHCAVGEVYHTFVNPSLDSVLRKEDQTSLAMVAISNVAKLKDTSEGGRKTLFDALNNLVMTNDSIDEDEDDTVAYVVRAEQVQRAWREQVIPLLK